MVFIGSRPRFAKTPAPQAASRICHGGNLQPEQQRSSALTQVHCDFCDITQSRLRRGIFRSVPELIAAIEGYLYHQAPSYNAQRLSEAKAQPEIRALVEKLAAVDRTKLAGIEAAIDAATTK